MKTFITACLMLFVGVQLNAQSDAPPIKFKESKFNFGSIGQGNPVSHEFEFVNTSDKMAVIETVSTSCGCTASDYPKTPIATRGVGKVKVTFNAAAVGKFDKKITVKIAKVDTPIILSIEGEVAPKK